MNSSGLETWLGERRIRQTGVRMLEGAPNPSAHFFSKNPSRVTCPNTVARNRQSTLDSARSEHQIVTVVDCPVGPERVSIPIV